MPAHCHPPSLRSFACRGALAAALAPAAATAQDPATPALSHDQLARTYSVAATLAAGVPCATTPPTQPDLEGARTLAQAAAMFDVAARNYPPPAPKVDPGAHAEKLAELILQATQVYEQAYRCAPGYEQRYHLENARALIDARLITIRELERRPADASDATRLSRRRSEIEALIPQAPAAPVVDPDPPPPRSEPPPPEPPSGYARYAGFFVLRPELGFGAAKIEHEQMTDSFNGAYLNLYAAARFTGKRRRHAFMLGGTFNIQQVAQRPDFDDERTSRALFGSALRLEGALHAHPRWFSFHPLLELGVQVYVGYEKLGRPFLGPGLGLCIDREIACITTKFTTSLISPGSSDARTLALQVGLGIDLMRIADRAKGLATP